METVRFYYNIHLNICGEENWEPIFSLKMKMRSREH